jgi:hypothetical protein
MLNAANFRNLPFVPLVTSGPSTKSLRDMALVLSVVLIWDLFRVL